MLYLNPFEFDQSEELAAILKVLNQHSIVSSTDAQGHITYANDRFCEISGYSLAELLGQNHGILNSGVHPPGFFKSMYETTLAGHVWQGDVCNRAKDGRRYWLQTTIAAVWNSDNALKMFVSIQTDITGQKEKYEQLELLRACIDRTNDVIIISEAEPIDPPGPRIVYVNNAFEKVTGFTRKEALGNTPRILQGAASNRAALDRIRASLAKWKPVREEVLNYTKDHQEFWAELDISPIANEDGWYTHWVSVQRDITQRKAAEAQAHKLAYYDPLTNLPNRRLMMDRLAHAVNARKLNGKIGALLFIDLDEFKTINDMQSHTFGDMMLRQVGERLVICIGGQDTVAHIGGDEFVVILDEVGQEGPDAASRAEKIGELILDSLRRPFQIDAKPFSLTASIGIVLFAEGSQSDEDLLKQAEIAMYQGKQAGRNCLRFFDPLMQEKIEHRAGLDRALQTAIAEQQFQLFYQVQVDGRGKPIGAEALIRWICPGRGVVSPLEFIPRAEENGMILSIGQWVLDEACRQLSRWSANPRTRDLTLSINVSARQFHQPDFVAQVVDAIELHSIQPERLEIELTEGVMLDNVDRAVAAMNALKGIGVKFSLDDFGSGYSSLQYLKRLPIDQFKIDRSFVRDIVDNVDDRAIVKTIIAMATALDLDVIAEGVETGEQFGMLAERGCAHFQGFFFGKPVPVAEFETILLTRSLS